MPVRSRPTRPRGKAAAPGRAAAAEKLPATSGDAIASGVAGAGTSSPPVAGPTASASGATMSRADQRRQAEELARARRKSASWGLFALIGAGIVVLVVGIVLLIVVVAQQSQPAALAEVYQAPSGYNQHLPVGTVISYPYNPPSSGPHYPSPADWGNYPQGVTTSTWVHNLEHGGIVLLYQCITACAALQQQLDQVYNQIPNETKFSERKVVITPYANLDHLIRLQAWGWTAPLDKVDSKAIDAFYQEHVDKGPEQIP